MRYKITFAAGFAAGYILGAKAGRERYETIMRLFRQVKEHPTVQETAGVVQAQAAGFVDKGKRTVTEKVSHRVGGRDVTDDLGTQPTAYPSSTSRAASAGGPT